MLGLVIGESNVSGTRNRLAVKLHARNSATYAAGIFHADAVLRRVIPEDDRIIRPSARNARIDAERCAAHAESQYPFQPGSVKPARRSGVPRPSSASYVGRLGIDVAGHHVGLDLVTLHARART